MSERHWPRPALVTTALALPGAPTEASAKKLATQAYQLAAQTLPSLTVMQDWWHD